MGAAHDLDTLLFAFLDELLFCFLTDLFVCKELVVARLARAPHWTLTAFGRAGPCHCRTLLLLQAQAS